MNDHFQNSNNSLWQSDTFAAYVNKYGSPEEAAKKVLKNPERILFPMKEDIGNLKFKKVANLMGSVGQKAVALSLLGADVTVFDLSNSHKIYAQALAAACGTSIHYEVGNVLDINQAIYGDYFEIAIAEMGIVHYFTDLDVFFRSVYEILRRDGFFILRDFHPVSTKLISSRGSTAKVRKHKVTGDYFSKELVEQEAAFSKYSENTVEEKVMLRKWTLGEIVTSLANKGFIIEKLREEPNYSSESFDAGIPKTFTVKCRK